MKIPMKGGPLDLHYNEYGNMFYLTGKNGDVKEWLCSRMEKAQPNQCWLDNRYVTKMAIAQVIMPHLDAQGYIEEREDKQIGGNVTLCDIVHAEFNDAGFAPFGDFSRGVLGTQCQYGSRYIMGRIEGYPALGEGLRFLHTDNGDYHAIRIHRDDMDEFARRYKAYQEDNYRG